MRRAFPPTCFPSRRREAWRRCGGSGSGSRGRSPHRACSRWISRGRGARWRELAGLGELEALELLAAYGIPVAAAALAEGPDAAARAAAALGFPVVLKAVAPELLHKTDAGGVRIGLTTPV
ncbi:MAG: hypothetical protein E6J91_19595 [Deltaproteobacteria bacterium]|nr:MAG: hypothetical protein E6J91_19595 [Deltaproteobacteria bacterium]